MKILYLDLNMGAAGDMLNAALYELLDEDAKKEFIAKMNGLGLSDVKVSAVSHKKNTIMGTRYVVEVGGVEESEPTEHDHHHEHEHEHDHHPEYDHHHEHDHHHGHGSHGPSEIRRLIEAMELPEKVKDDAIEVYERIAEAESKVHGVPVSDIHFHEVGRLDAICDVVGFCYLLDILSPDRVVCSHLRVGNGMVMTQHGKMPVPAPATALLLSGIPVYTGEIQGELCTPTGAALIKFAAEDFGKMPSMRIEKIGYGMGKKDFSEVNCVRAFWGEEVSSEESMPTDGKDNVTELSCNMDDMTGEEMGFCIECLMKEGAKDAFVTAVTMKKNRPGMLLTVLCDPVDEEKMVRLIFLHTTTIGIRKCKKERAVLSRSEVTRHTKYGDVRYKVSEGYGVKRIKPEYDDLKRIAEDKGLSVNEVKQKISTENENCP